jgi:hypothetical protein
MLRRISGVYSIVPQYDPTKLPAGVVEVWVQNQIQYGPVDSILSNHTSRTEFNSKLGCRKNMNILFLKTYKGWLQEIEIYVETVKEKIW